MSDKNNEVLDKEELLMNEDDMLKGLLQAAENRDNDIKKVEVVREGKVLFAFRIRALGESDYSECREKATKYFRNKKLGGIKLPEETDTTRYRSYLIYRATIEADRAKLWDNKEAQKKLDVLNGPDLIDEVLKAGEKDGIVDLIDNISGFREDMEEAAKNS